MGNMGAKAYRLILGFKTVALAVFLQSAFVADVRTDAILVATDDAPQAFRLERKTMHIARLLGKLNQTN